MRCRPPSPVPVVVPFAYAGVAHGIGKFGLVVDPEFGIAALDMRPHGVLADEELFGDLGLAAAHAIEAEHLKLARGQAAPAEGLDGAWKRSR